MVVKTIKGDLVKLFKERQFDVIIHGCNCFNTMGAGIAKQIKEEFPDAYRVDKATIKGDSYKLGNYSFASITCKENTYRYIINAYTQYDFRGKNPISYKAISDVFSLLNKCTMLQGMKVGIPKIGAELAGGDWEHILYLINKATPDLDITLVEYNK